MMNRCGTILRSNRGITLVEILVSVFLLSVSITASLAYFATAKTAAQLARNQTTATIHGEYILEDMQARATLAAITTTDWAAFVAGAGLNTLTDEVITVAFADQTADPLNITVTVNWTTNTQAHSISLITEMTK